MKLAELHEGASPIMDTKTLVAMAIKAGKSMFDGHGSGFKFGSEKVTTISYEDFVEENEGDFGTMQYTFNPRTGKGTDSSDTKIKKSLAVDGVIYVGDADEGVICVLLPGVKVKAEARKKMSKTEWEKAVLAKYPEADFVKKIGRFDGVIEDGIHTKTVGVWHVNDNDGEVYSSPRKL